MAAEFKGEALKAPPYLLLVMGRLWWSAPRVRRLSASGCNSTGTKFVRDDFRLPSSTNDVGPSTAILFQGGEMGLCPDALPVAESASFRFLFGGVSMPLSACCRSPVSRAPFCR